LRWQRSILASQTDRADVDDNNVSGQVTAAYQFMVLVERERLSLPDRGWLLARQRASRSALGQRLVGLGLGA
jgi:hypothetical protein